MVHLPETGLSQTSVMKTCILVTILMLQRDTVNKDTYKRKTFIWWIFTASENVSMAASIETGRHGTGGVEEESFNLSVVSCEQRKRELTRNDRGLKKLQSLSPVIHFLQPNYSLMHL